MNVDQVNALLETIEDAFKQLSLVPSGEASELIAMKGMRTSLRWHNHFVEMRREQLFGNTPIRSTKG